MNRYISTPSPFMLRFSVHLVERLLCDSHLDNGCVDVHYLQYISVQVFRICYIQGYLGPFRFDSTCKTKADNVYVEPSFMSSQSQFSRYQRHYYHG